MVARERRGKTAQRTAIKKTFCGTVRHGPFRVFLIGTDAVKIVAVVHESAITDYDVHQFSKIICNMERMDYCNYDRIFPVALSSLVEENLKSEHLKKMEIKEENIVKEYEEYKRNIPNLNAMKLGVDEDLFEWYMHTEFMWSSIVAMQVNASITQNEIAQYAEKHNIKNTKENQKDIRMGIYQEKFPKKDRALVDEIRKFYLVDIKI